MPLPQTTSRFLLLFVLCTRGVWAAEPTLPNTQRWIPPLDIVAEQFRELKDYYDRQLRAAAAERTRSTPGSPTEHRQALRHILGIQDDLLPPKPVLTAAGPNTWLVSWPIHRIGTIGPTMGGTQFTVRAYGVLQKPPQPGRFPVLLALPDANESAVEAARRWARPGFIVYSPFLVQREAFTEPWLDDRAWLVRLAYLTGRHLVGSEVQQVSSAIDFLSQVPEADTSRIAVAGAGQGVLIAKFAAALDERITTSLVTGDPGPLYTDPEDRMLWGYARRFGESELASLIAPRKLSVAAAPPPPNATQSIPPNTVALIRNHQFTEWQAWYRNRATEAYRVRETNWKPDTSSVAAYRRSIQPQLDAYFDGIGRYPQPSGPLEPQSLLLHDTPKFTGYHLQVRVYQGVHAYGILLVPKGIPPGQRRPVVFAQHGFPNLPQDAVGLETTPRLKEVYGQFGMRLAERGYIVFAPMISVQDGIKRTQLVRQSHLLALTPVGLELKKFSRVLDFLGTLPFADITRAGFYGLSYGGYTALRIGPGEPRFQVVISSGDFNETTLKNTDPTQGTSFLFYPITLDRYKFGWLNHLTDSVLASLIAPRAYMTEMGDQDSVIVEPRRAVDLEIERYMQIYRRLGIPERGQVSRFNGPHQIHGVDTFSFLDTFLKP